MSPAKAELRWVCCAFTDISEPHAVQLCVCRTRRVVNNCAAVRVGFVHNDKFTRISSNNRELDSDGGTGAQVGGGGYDTSRLVGAQEKITLTSGHGDQQSGENSQNQSVQ